MLLCRMFCESKPCIRGSNEFVFESTAHPKLRIFAVLCIRFPIWLFGSGTGQLSAVIYRIWWPKHIFLYQDSYLSDRTSLVRELLVRQSQQPVWDDRTGVMPNTAGLFPLLPLSVSVFVGAVGPVASRRLAGDSVFVWWGIPVFRSLLHPIAMMACQMWLATHRKSLACAIKWIRTNH